MTKNPIINAVGASAYIMLVVGLMNFVSETLGSKPDSAFAPVLFISLLTLSVSVMAYAFFYQPLLLLIDGKKMDAVNLFVQTVVVFGGITLVVLVLLFSGVI
jgi:hypothetical protein